jgi:hypothetical protein
VDNSKIETIKIKNFFVQNPIYLKHAFEQKTIAIAEKAIKNENPEIFINLVQNTLKWFQKMPKNWTADGVISEIKIAKQINYLP